LFCLTNAAIHSAAGPELLAACYAVPEVTRGVRCPTGSAVITGGFNLPASKVIHTVGPIYSSDEVSAEPLAKAYRSSVAVATEAGVKYIAFPAISCGVYGYPHKKAAKIAIQTLKESSGGLLEVHFVLFNESTWNVWLAEAEACLKKA
jgi:O-acetyl-ADP-ribose deacetylase (regulator of RNase III)